MHNQLVLVDTGDGKEAPPLGESPWPDRGERIWIGWIGTAPYATPFGAIAPSVFPELGLEQFPDCRDCVCGVRTVADNRDLRA
jgi:hypothetical protein